MRPLSSAPFDMLERHRIGQAYEPKLGGIRVVLHVPSGKMWNRHGQVLTHSAAFKVAADKLKVLMDGKAEWLDCEGFPNGSFGVGTLVVLDVIVRGLTYPERRALFAHIPQFQVVSPGEVPTNEALAIPSFDLEGAKELWVKMKQVDPKAGVQLTKGMGLPLYEGLVAKRVDSQYVHQMRSDKQDSPGWTKHRWL
jgi:hypothetical protein